jgi:hypothetical protein
MGFDVSGRFCAKMVKYTANVKKMFVAKPMLMFTPWGYESHEIDFAPTTTYARTDQFIENQEWKLSGTSLNTTIQANRSILTFTLHILFSLQFQCLNQLDR